jgi:hypothetical protein
MTLHTKDDVAKTMELVFSEVRSLRVAGQQEYAHQDDRPFRNFEAMAEEMNVDRKVPWWFLFKKHIDGIQAYINGHKSQREDVRGRINDAMTYLVILRAMIDEEDSFVLAPRSVTIQSTIDPQNPITREVSLYPGRQS